MGLSIDELNHVTKDLRLSSRTVEAVRRVLVDGEKQVNVARDMDMDRQQVNRAVKRVHDKQREMGLLDSDPLAISAQVTAVEREMDASYTLAVKKARELKGDSASIRMAEPGHFYIGKGVVRTPQHLVQEVGRNELVVHENRNLERIPSMGSGAVLEIRYSNGRQTASVAEKEQVKIRGGLSH
ncbi:KfrB domain-containing protein [Chromobacterium vaccinii]|uniref:KfrB domain-containing protein n=1 Tax=Chromobacterium vaccinii TaxID=1108595 RepID=UPI003C715E48